MFEGSHGSISQTACTTTTTTTTTTQRGDWIQGSPTDCGDMKTCGIAPGAKGKPGTVTCSTGSHLGCDASTKPSPKLCPGTLHLQICGEKGFCVHNRCVCTEDY